MKEYQKQKTRITISPKSVIILIAICAIACPYIWRYLIRPIIDTRASYEGRIVKRYKKWRREGPYRSHYVYYWEIARSNGRDISIEVDFLLWNQGQINFRVQKISGERYPRLKELEDKKQLREQYIKNIENGKIPKNPLD